MGSRFMIKAVLAFMVFPFMAYEGLSRGATFGAVDADRPVIMEVRSTINANGRTILPDFQALGRLLSTGEEIAVSVYKREFETLKPGDRLPVFAVPSQPGVFVTGKQLDESRPLFRVGAFVFTWHLPAAIVGWLVVGAFLFQRAAGRRRP